MPRLPRSGRESDEDDPSRRLPISVDELAKVLVFGQQDGPACASKLKDDFVGGTASDLGDGGYVATVGP